MTEHPVGDHVVTGAGRGVGRALVERLLADGDHVVALHSDAAALGWVERHPARTHLDAVVVVVGAADEAVAARAADRPQDVGRLVDWVDDARNPDQEVASEHIDALAAKVVLDPGRFDVITGSHLFGDIPSA